MDEIKHCNICFYNQKDQISFVSQENALLILSKCHTLTLAER